jgi:indolepyruvate ferredoxin oxidoreductase beta subunit
VPHPEWEGTKAILGEYTKKVYLVPASEIGAEIGNTRALNVVLLGFISHFLDIKQETWRETIKEKIPPLYAASSIRAFKRGALSAAKMISTVKEAKK